MYSAHSGALQCEMTEKVWLVLKCVCRTHNVVVFRHKEIKFSARVLHFFTLLFLFSAKALVINHRRKLHWSVINAKSTLSSPTFRLYVA